MSWGDASSHRPSPAFRNLDYEDEPGWERHPTRTLAEAMDALWWHGGL